MALHRRNLLALPPPPTPNFPFSTPPHTQAFKMLFIKGAKPLAVAVGSYVAYKGYEEWAQAGRVLKISTDKKQMESLFDKIDVDKSGSISADELQKALHNEGMDVNMLELKAMMYTADKDSNGYLDKEEWVALVNKLLEDRTPNTADKAVERLVAGRQAVQHSKGEKDTDKDKVSFSNLYATKK